MLEAVRAWEEAYLLEPTNLRAREFLRSALERIHAHMGPAANQAPPATPPAQDQLEVVDERHSQHLSHRGNPIHRLLTHPGPGCQGDHLRPRTLARNEGPRQNIPVAFTS